MDYNFDQFAKQCIYCKDSINKDYGIYHCEKYEICDIDKCKMWKYLIVILNQSRFYS